MSLKLPIITLERPANLEEKFIKPNWATYPTQGVALVISRDGDWLSALQLDGNAKYYLFGRAPSCPCKEGGFFVINHPTLSRQHAVIIHGEHDTVYIADLASRHGTQVNNEPLIPYEPKLLENGNIITFGQSLRQYVTRIFPKEAENVLDNTSGNLSLSESTSRLVAMNFDDTTADTTHLTDSPLQRKNQSQTAYFTKLNSGIAPSDAILAAKIAASASPMLRPVTNTNTVNLTTAPVQSSLRSEISNDLEDTAMLPPSASEPVTVVRSRSLSSMEDEMQCSDSSPESESPNGKRSENGAVIALLKPDIFRGRSSSMSATTCLKGSNLTTSLLLRPRNRRVSFSSNEPELIGPSRMFPEPQAEQADDGLPPPIPISGVDCCADESHPHGIWLDNNSPESRTKKYSRPRFASHPVEHSGAIELMHVIRSDFSLTESPRSPISEADNNSLPSPPSPPSDSNGSDSHMIKRQKT